MHDPPLSSVYTIPTFIPTVSNQRSTIKENDEPIILKNMIPILVYSNLVWPKTTKTLKPWLKERRRNVGWCSPPHPLRTPTPSNTYSTLKHTLSHTHKHSYICIKQCDSKMNQHTNDSETKRYNCDSKMNQCAYNLVWFKLITLCKLYTVNNKIYKMTKEETDGKMYRKGRIKIT